MHIILTKKKCAPHFLLFPFLGENKTLRVDEDSKVEFPTIIPSEDGSPARLLGLGVRKITFLKVQVYVVGLYAKASDLDDHNSRFRALPEVQKFQRTDTVSSDTAFRAIVQNPIELVLRIVPVRNTNGPHLRDGFTRNLTQAAKHQKLDDIENEVTPLSLFFLAANWMYTF
jgi:hypothetical protein